MLSNPFMFVHPSPSSARREPPQPVSSSPFAKMNRWCNILLLHCCYYHFAGRCDAFSCTSQLAATSPARRRFCERRSGRPPHGTTSWHPTKLGHQRGSARPLRSTVSDVGVVASSLSEDALVETDDVGDGLPPSHDPWIIQWRGEGTEGYSEALRQLEFTSAFRAEMKDYFMFRSGAAIEDSSILKSFLDRIHFRFQDGLAYSGPIYGDGDSIDDEFEGVEPIPLAQVAAYESAMQFVAISLPSAPERSRALPAVDARTLGEVFQYAIQRCSLIRTAFEIVARGESYEKLASIALENDSFTDMMEGGDRKDATWSIRLRRYGPMEVIGGGGNGLNMSNSKQSKRQARYGKNVRSPLRDERKAIMQMAELVKLFQGKVDLTDPECRIYLLEGMKRCTLFDQGDSEKNKMLARVIAKGPKTSIYKPNTRICITTTPLCPIASFTLCNIAQLQRHGNPSILDPFAGSCATLLAAAHITSVPLSAASSTSNNLQSDTSLRGCRSVGIEIAHNGYVNRDDILEDFATRSLPPPADIIRGDCLSSEVRQQARLAIGGGAFDVIVTDPPYGIREAMSSEEDDEHDDEISPLTQLFYAMAQDRSNGTPLLRSGGRLVAFVPVRKGETLNECLPSMDARKEAGLSIEGEGKEQVLSDILSRWIVSFVSV